MKKNLHSVSALFSLAALLWCSAAFAQITNYASIPYSTGFENGVLDNNWYTTTNPGGRIQIWNSTSLTWSSMTATAHTDSLWLGMDASPGGSYVINEAWMGLDLLGRSSVTLSFWWSEWNDESEAEDGVYISDDGGTTFVKVLDLPGAAYTDLQWNFFELNLDSVNTFHSLSFTSTYVVKFQQYDNYYFAGGNDGHLYDDISVSQLCTNSTSSISPTSCISYTTPSGNATYTTSGTYMDTIPNQSGCDSIITINLTVNSVDVAVTTLLSTITASATNATYQWLDCANNYSIISGETSASYTATVDGDYAVEVGQNGCIDTSLCVSLINVGLIENAFEQNLSFYPNPTEGAVSINLGSYYKKVSASVYNAIGQLISQEDFGSAAEIQLEIKGSRGFYFVRVTSADNRTALVKVQKQ